MVSENNRQKLSIVYFGNGPLAAESLAFLHQRFSVEAVITKPRPSHHRGSVPVLEFCENEQLAYFTPANKEELAHLFSRQSFQSKLGVVIDYGIIISQDVIDAFRFGIVNSHFSLLPEWRGADPITFALLSGQPQTGVSLMLINNRMDEGPLLAQATINIANNHNAVSLTADLLDISNGLLDEILPLYMADQLQPVPQTSSIATNPQPSYSRKLTKQDGTIDWQKPAEQIEREIRAYTTWPKSRTHLAKREIIITKAKVWPNFTEVPGSIHVIDKRLVIGTAQNGLEILQLKPAGKPEMTTEAFVAGYGRLL